MLRNNRKMRHRVFENMKEDYNWNGKLKIRDKKYVANFRHVDKKYVSRIYSSKLSRVHTSLSQISFILKFT